MATRKLQVEIIGDASSLNRALGQAQTKTSRFGRVAKTALVGGAAAGFYALGKAAKIGWDEFNAGQRVAAQTNAVIKSTGGVANITAQEVEDLGHALMLKSGIDDEVIKSGENVLLTFRNIHNEVGKGNDIFDQATKLTLDLSVAMGRDLNSSAVLVGKALNNPTKALSALTRVGVQFSAAQEETIKRLFETGHAMEAQKMILKELRVEFGGSAAAAGKTFGGQLNILRERLNNFLGDVTRKAIPYLQRLMKWLGPRMHEAAESARKAWADLGAMLSRHQSTIDKVRVALGFVVRALGLLIRWEKFLYTTIWNVWMKILNVTLTVTDKIIGFIQNVIDKLKDFWGATQQARDIARAAFNAMIQPIKNVIGVVQTLIGWIQDAIGWFTDLLGLSNSNIGSGLGGAAGSGAGGAGGRPTGVAPRMATGLTPRLATASDATVNVYMDGELFYRTMRRIEARHGRRNG